MTPASVVVVQPQRMLVPAMGGGAVLAAAAAAASSASASSSAAVGFSPFSASTPSRPMPNWDKIKDDPILSQRHGPQVSHWSSFSVSAKRVKEKLVQTRHEHGVKKRRAADHGNMNRSQLRERLRREEKEVFPVLSVIPCSSPPLLGRTALVATGK